MIYLLCLLLLFVDPGSSPATQPTALRGHDPWVFRCALDDRPRMVVIAVSPGWWIAFDAANGSFYRAWEGDVEFTGTVYDTRHGPQPRAVGEPLFASEPIRLIGRDGRDLPFEWRWRGYRFVNGEVELLLSAGESEGREVTVSLSPRVLLEEGRATGIRIVMAVSGLGDGESCEFALVRMNRARITTGSMGLSPDAAVPTRFIPFPERDSYRARFGPMRDSVFFDLEISSK